MTSKNLFFLFYILLSMIGTKAFASDIAVANADGVTIYYNYINDGKELEVSSKYNTYSNYSVDYSGIVTIPEEVTSMNRTRRVTRIGEHAFHGCVNLTSVTIPNSVTSIGWGAFASCEGLTSVTIPSSVTSIVSSAFYGCRGLTSFSVDEANTTYKSVDGILMSKDGAILVVYPVGKAEITFNIPNTVTTIGGGAFHGCGNLTFVTIPNSVTSIETGAFEDCTALTSVTIPNSVTKIGHSAFYLCTALTSVTIGNSVTDIGPYAFSYCRNLTTVMIPNSVTYIGEYAFANCDIPEVISKIENPSDYNIKTNTFSNNTFYNATLYVPSGTIEKYKNKEGWKEFMYIEEGTPNCIEQVHSKAKLIQCESGILTVQNVKDDTPINVYTTNGTMVGSTISQNGHATISTNLQQGTVTIIKIGDKSIKTIIK